MSGIAITRPMYADWIGRGSGVSLSNTDSEEDTSKTPKQLILFDV